MDSIEKLKNIFRTFPSVGPKAASRFVYYLLKLPKQNIEELAKAIQELHSKVKLCGFCYSPFESFNTDLKLCSICQNASRNKNLLCVIEKESDLLPLENTKKFNGLYFILGGTVSVVKTEDVSRLRMEELKERVQKNNFEEIIIALNPTPEGRTTSALVENAIKDITKNPNPKITRLAKGIPVGGELEYADEETLESALEGRK